MQRYVFKPMKSLSAWTFGLITAFMVSLTAYTGAMALAMVGMSSDVFFLGLGLAALAFMLFYFAAGIVTLIWLYGAARNARSMKPNLDLTPGWAVGWYFIPIANLFKPFTTLCLIWDASRAPGTKPASAMPIAAWWWLNIIGNITMSIGSRISDAETFGMTPGDILQVVGAISTIVSTWIFLNLIRELHHNQLNSDTKVADQF
ncbi:hypothetical protein ABAC460_18660 [Asticcacaulis sp. AC460]|uniref:DUF4328 domain-containing protein n=1 Tax=Asticcacaulis sp. AC460 TaxID=1282360 RepID=UPI0003C3C86F|nr:DUF4328 domain-containing protein [Asticcacaulis sp. AC460]ESQ87696.1 hypothetical protein ABAC460_18660 [Asticcacaulis sp. AC460]